MKRANRAKMITQMLASPGNAIGEAAINIVSIF
jgi:hypothetical protein